MPNCHIVPLAKQSLEVLAMLRELTKQSEWLFPGDRNAKKPMSNNTILKSPRKRMGYKGRMTGHGFRGLASTILHEHGYAHEHILELLTCCTLHATRSVLRTTMLCTRATSKNDAGLGRLFGANTEGNQSDSAARACSVAVQVGYGVVR